MKRPVLRKQSVKYIHYTYIYIYIKRHIPRHNQQVSNITSARCNFP